MYVPAFCDVCGAVFNSGIEVDSVADKSFIGKDAGRCPVCRVPGHVADDIFEQIEKLISLLNTPERTTGELTRLVEILSEGVEKKSDPEVIAAQIQDDAESLSGIRELLPASGRDLTTFVTMAVSLSILVWKTGGESGAKEPISVEKAVEHILSEMDAMAPALRHRVGRNAPCPCGSGKKHKQCCGTLARSG